MKYKKNANLNVERVSVVDPERVQRHVGESTLLHLAVWSEVKQSDAVVRNACIFFQESEIEKIDVLFSMDYTFLWCAKRSSVWETSKILFKNLEMGMGNE